MRKMALDLGDRRTGVAFSDPMGIIASGYETFIMKNSDADCYYAIELARKNKVDTIVIGLPINMDGSEGERALKCKAFGEKLLSITNEFKVVYMDERLTTVTAEKMLIDADVRRDKRKTVVDKVAATLILQSFLDSPQNK